MTSVRRILTQPVGVSVRVSRMHGTVSTMTMLAGTLLALGTLLSGTDAKNNAPELFTVVAPKHDHIAK